MYCVISWDISAVDATWNELDAKMRNCFHGLNWFKPVYTFYLVEIFDNFRYNTLLQDLQRVAGSTPIMVRFVMSPMISAQNWDGWLNPEHWPEVRRITG